MMCKCDMYAWCVHETCTRDMYTWCVHVGCIHDVYTQHTHTHVLNCGLYTTHHYYGYTNMKLRCTCTNVVVQCSDTCTWATCTPDVYNQTRTCTTMHVYAYMHTVLYQLIHWTVKVNAMFTTNINTPSTAASVIHMTLHLTHKLVHKLHIQSREYPCCLCTPRDVLGS